MQNAIITYNWDDLSYQQAFEKVVIPRLEYLSKKFGAELIISNTSNPNIKNNFPEDKNFRNKYNKLYALKNLVSKFDRSLCIDPCVVLAKNMPNIFDIFLPEYFYAVLDGAEGDENCFHRMEEMIASQAILGSIGWSNGYYNTALMILNNTHSKIFEDENYKIYFKLFEETKINYFLRKYNFNHKNLPRQFNSHAFNILRSNNTEMNTNIILPEVLAANTYAVNTSYLQEEIKNDYIFKLDLIMS